MAAFEGRLEEASVTVNGKMVDIPIAEECRLLAYVVP